MSNFFAGTFQRFCRNISERLLKTCEKFSAIFRKIVLILFVRNIPNNKSLDVTNKETKKVL